MNLIPMPIAPSGRAGARWSLRRHLDGTTTSRRPVEKPKPMIGRGWERSTTRPTNGAEAPGRDDHRRGLSAAGGVSPRTDYA